MSRLICLKPCAPLPPLNLTIPFMGAGLSGSGNLNLDSGCANCEIVGNFMLQLNPLLSALGLPLCLLGCAAAMLEFALAVPDALGPPPNPGKLVTAVTNLAPACSCLVGMALPPPVGPICDFLKMVRDIVQLFFEILSCLVGLVQHLITLNLSASLMLGSPVPGIVSAGQCLSDQILLLMDALNGKLGGFNTIIGIMKPIFTLLGALVPSPFNTQITNLQNGFAVFTASTSIGTPPGSFLTSLQTLVTIVGDVYAALQTLAQVCP